MAEDITNQHPPGSQISLQDLPHSVPVADVYKQMQQDDVAFADESKHMTSAVAEVVQNFGLAEGYMQARGLRTFWDITEVMLRAYVEPVKWKGSPDVYRSNLGIPIIAENFYSLMSAIMQGFWGQLRNFQIDPAGDTDIDCALAQENLVVQFLKTGSPYGDVGTKSEFRRIVYDGLIYGTGVGQKCWEVKKYRKLIKRRKNKNVDVAFGVGRISVPQGDPDELEDDVKEFEYNHPMLRHIPIRRFRIAPECYRSDPRTARWAGAYLYSNAYELNDLRDVEGWNIPTEGQLIKLTTPSKRDGTQQNPLDYQGSSFPDYRFTNPQKAFPPYMPQQNNADPLMWDFEIFDYWTKDRHIVVLERQYELLNEPNEFNEIPYVGFAFREAPDSFWGWGLGNWLTDFQKIAQGIINSFFDQWSLALQKPVARPMGLNVRGQAETIFPGKVFQVEGGATALKTLDVGEMQQGLQPLALIQEVKGWAASLTGAGAGVQGQYPGKSGDMRTPAGANLIAGGEALKSEDLMDIIGDQIFVPFVQFCIDWSHKLKPTQIQMMLSKSLAKAYDGDPIDIMNGDYVVTISAATKLAARQRVNSTLGMLATMIQNGGLIQQLAAQRIKFNAPNFVKLLFESTGYPYREDVFEPMTDQEFQGWQQAQQGPPPDIKGQLTLNAAKGDQKIRAQENQAENKALLVEQKHMLEGGEKPFFEGS